MPTPRSHRRARLAALLSAVLAITGFQLLLAPQAQAAGPGLVIQEVYGAGGNGGAAYSADYVELYTSSGTAVSLAGKYIHYKSAAGGSGGNPFALTGSV